MYTGRHCKVSVILVRFHPNLNFLDRLSKTAQIANSMKICPVGAEILHANGRTDGRKNRYDEDNSRFAHFFERA